MKKIFTGIALFSIFMATVTILLSRTFRVNQVPNGIVGSCQTCHVTPGGPRNDFGRLVESRFLSTPGAAGNVEWSPYLASLDADNDGATNGEELQDPFGKWSSGTQNPGDPALVTEPGSSGSNPFTPLTIQFTGMTPHIGQKFEIRVYNRTKNLEAARLSTTVPSDNFEETFDVLLKENSYLVEFYADLNGNGMYDIPPVDHAWQLVLDNAQGNDILMFSHNTNFVDIDWRYLLTVNFSGMSPHSNQLLELRVSDKSSSSEIGRARVEWISGDQFSLGVPGLEMGKDYRVDFYADHNGNGTYDIPPSDHAWRLDFVNTTGDFELNFSHNTNFTDIQWQYMLTLNLSGMENNSDQSMGFRVLDNITQDEVGRYMLDRVGTGRFSVRIPGLQNQADYRVDFFADANDNGQYDPPPADEAWSLPFFTDNGNAVNNFEWNNSFVDIQWPNVTSVTPDETALPAGFALDQNYPNPFNPSTTIRYSMPADGYVNLSVYNSIGEKVATLIDDIKPAGLHEVRFNASNLSSGIYFYSMRSGNFSETKKLILMK